MSDLYLLSEVAPLSKFRLGLVERYGEDFAYFVTFDTPHIVMDRVDDVFEKGASPDFYNGGWWSLFGRFYTVKSKDILDIEIRTVAKGCRTLCNKDGYRSTTLTSVILVRGNDMFRMILIPETVKRDDFSYTSNRNNLLCNPDENGDDTSIWVSNDHLIAGRFIVMESSPGIAKVMATIIRLASD